jgi:hypothetical protein
MLAEEIFHDGKYRASHFKLAQIKMILHTLQADLHGHYSRYN